MSRLPVVMDGDDGALTSRYRVPEKREERSRAELLGVTGGQPRVPKAKARHAAAQAAVEAEKPNNGYDPLDQYSRSRVTAEAYEYDSRSDNPLMRAEQRELEQLAVKKSKEVTSDLRHALKISEDTKKIGAQTLVTLHEQGEQLSRTHEKVVQVDQELAKGEKLLGRLGPMFSFGWKPKKGKKITGSDYRPGDDPSSYSGDPSSRGELGLKGERAQRTAGDADGWQDQVEAEQDEQDDILDAVSANLTDLKKMALDMGREMEKQEKVIDEITEDAKELNKRQVAANVRGKRILGRRW